jgi:hypothetical protein
MPSTVSPSPVAAIADEVLAQQQPLPAGPERDELIRRLVTQDHLSDWAIGDDPRIQLSRERVGQIRERLGIPRPRPRKEDRRPAKLYRPDTQRLAAIAKAMASHLPADDPRRMTRGRRRVTYARALSSALDALAAFEALADGAGETVPREALLEVLRQAGLRRPKP